MVLPGLNRPFPNPDNFAAAPTDFKEKVKTCEEHDEKTLHALIGDFTCFNFLFKISWCGSKIIWIWKWAI